MSAIGGCGVFQQFRSLPRATTTMPAQHSSSTRTTSIGGSFVEGSSSHNQHRFSSAWDNLSRPYPTNCDVYRRSNTHNPDDDEFAEIRLSDFFLAHRRVSRHKLEHLQLTPYQAGLLSRGVQVEMERREPYNAGLEAAMGYTGLCSMAVMDDVALVNEKVDKLDEGLGEEVVRLDMICQELLRDLEDERARAWESDRFLSREVVSLKVLADSLVRTVGELRDDLVRQTLLNAALSRRVPVDQAAEMPRQLIPYQGRLVPIEVPNRSGPVMALDLTDEDELPSTEESLGSDVRDFAAEEEEQAEGSRQRGEVVEHAAIVAAQMDPAPEYEAAPEYD